MRGTFTVNSDGLALRSPTASVEMRDAARVADEENDPGTNDLFATLVQGHEKNAWFIDEFLRRGDGMVS